MIKKVPYNFSYMEHTWLVPIIHPVDKYCQVKEFWEMTKEEKQVEYYLVSRGYRESKMRLPTLDTKRVCDLRVIAGNKDEIG
jgi:hypothetical protein